MPTQQTDAVVLFPHQLFASLACFSPERPIFLVEDTLFFGDKQYPAQFHVQKLIFHRASMQAAAQHWRQAGYCVYEVPYTAEKPLSGLGQHLAQHGVTTLWVPDLVDDVLEQRLLRLATKQRLTVHFLDTPAFLCSRDEVRQRLGSRQRFSHSSFYIAQRKHFQLLLTDTQQPLGGQWSFDPANRKRLPKNHPVPPTRSWEHPQVALARAHILAHFPEAPGQAGPLIYPVTHADAESWLSDFLHERLAAFGDYEDALAQQHDRLFHGMLSPLLNSGLLTPQKVLEQTLAHAAAHAVPLNALEGFLRQIVGWREYMRGIYQEQGRAQRNSNFFGHLKPIPDKLRRGETGLFPIDHVIHKVARLAYAHHIERLMVLGNFMCLCEIHPTAIYTWFMEQFIDAYDWVMVPNVYGMSQYADGGKITTKPYISSSNYLRKMSDFPSGAWCEIWDGLYWRFIDRHRSFFSGNPRLSVMVRQLDKMEPERLRLHQMRADDFLKTLWD
ncbi:MAG: cryptochrome/photolyase family protein [Candidatus Sericytochromatia bacterium]